jgi:cytochrome c-type biogenesis protein
LRNFGSRHVGAAQQRGLGGEVAVGVLLGAVWSPCVGQTLWAATLLAAQKRHLPLVAMTMFAFGLGAVLPLLALGLLFRQSLTRWRVCLFSAGHGAKMASA